MNKEQIIQVARDVGILEPLGYENPYLNNWRDDIVIKLQRFAFAIRADTKEEDARICDQLANATSGSELHWISSSCANAIRSSK